MNLFGRGVLELLAGLWILFGGLGLLMTATSLADPLTASPGWQWTIGASVALVLGGTATLRRLRGARWIAVAGVAGGLGEAMAWLWWMWTPILVATALFHAYGLLVLVRTEFRTIGGPSAVRAPGAGVRGRSRRRKCLGDWWYSGP